MAHRGFIPGPGGAAAITATRHKRVNPAIRVQIAHRDRSAHIPVSSVIPRR